MITLKNLLVIGLGGMIGSMLRYSVTILVGQHAFPVATFIINVIGSFCIGIIFGLALHYFSSNTVRLFLATGICGGFTTFAAFSIETVQMLHLEKYLLAATYVTASIILSIAAASLGFYISKS